MNLNDLRNSAYSNAKKDGEEIKAQESFTGEGFKKFGAAAAAEVLKEQGLLKVPVQEPEEEGKESVYRRVAKFFLLIGEDEAAKILPHLTDKQIEKIIPELASIRSVSKEEATAILEEFQSLLDEAKKSGGVETAREMLTKAYGKERAEQMLQKSMIEPTPKPFEYLAGEETEKIQLLLKDENVGVKSLVLSYLPPKEAAAVINKMKDDDKKEVVLRLAKMEPVSPEVLKRLDKAMKEKSRTITTEKTENIDGRNALAQILKKMDSGAEADIIKSLSADDPDLGQDLKKRLFTQEDVIASDDKFIQETLREFSDEDLAYLIAAKPDDFRDKILDNISQGRRTEVLEQEDLLKPMKRTDCERITSQFVGILRRAYEDGELIIKGRNDEQYI
ncbi:MAG: flagellar motor switch protein FliG [Treponema sp.]|nr:flagellar motor switch protein FliG [Treponema sp.]